MLCAYVFYIFYVFMCECTICLCFIYTFVSVSLKTMSSDWFRYLRLWNYHDRSRRFLNIVCFYVCECTSDGIYHMFPFECIIACLHFSWLFRKLSFHSQTYIYTYIHTHRHKKYISCKRMSCHAMR